MTLDDSNGQIHNYQSTGTRIKRAVPLAVAAVGAKSGTVDLSIKEFIDLFGVFGGVLGLIADGPDLVTGGEECDVSSRLEKDYKEMISDFKEQIKLTDHMNQCTMPSLKIFEKFKTFFFFGNWSIKASV